MRFVAISVFVLAVCSIALSQESVSTMKAASATAAVPLAGVSESQEKPPFVGRIAQKFCCSPEKAGPLSVTGKFRYFASHSARVNIATTAFSAGFGQALDRPEGYGQGGEGYGKRFGANLATATSRSFIGDFVIPSALHLDPQFHRQGDGSFGQSFKYAFRHVVMTRSDKGDGAFNWGGILAPIAAQGIANSYLPEHERTVGKTFIRSGRMIGISIGMNLLKEYSPTICRKLGCCKKQ